MNFADRLDQAARRAGNPCLVGIDPHPELLPEPFAGVRDARLPREERARLLGDFAMKRHSERWLTAWALEKPAAKRPADE